MDVVGGVSGFRHGCVFFALDLTLDLDVDGSTVFCLLCVERPVRSFEVLSDICESWNSDKIVNLLVIKKTLLAPLLSRTVSVLPSSGIVWSGY